MKKNLRSWVLFATLLTTTIFAYGQENESSFNRDAFYKAMQVDKMDIVNTELDHIKSTSIKEKEAFEGALTMKKAGLSSGASRKLKIFKSGHKKLENAIQQNPDNIEFRFLRLMVQEHAPGILGYKKEINTDSELIRKSYKKLPGSVQQAVIDYNKKSKVLKLQDS